MRTLLTQFNSTTSRPKHRAADVPGADDAGDTVQVCGGGSEKVGVKVAPATRVPFNLVAENRRMLMSTPAATTDTKRNSPYLHFGCTCPLARRHWVHHQLPSHSHPRQQHHFHCWLTGSGRFRLCSRNARSTTIHPLTFNFLRQEVISCSSWTIPSADSPNCRGALLEGYCPDYSKAQDLLEQEGRWIGMMKRQCQSITSKSEVRYSPAFMLYGGTTIWNPSFPLEPLHLP